MLNNTKELLRKLPKIDEVLKNQRLFVFFEEEPRELIVDAVREEIDFARKNILNGEFDINEGFDQEKIINSVVLRIEKKKQRSLRRVINATGTIIHTNLGRARISEKICDIIKETASGYSTLEYDLSRGNRGSRHNHIDRVITKILPAEAAMAVNNNAAGLLLCLSALAKGKEVVVSRGELVEIGGSFRIPEIMELGGAILKEVGTTNKTRIEDYRKAVDSGDVGMLLKVHTSNYKIMGFTSEASLAELVELGREKGIPVVHDLGSGLMIDLKEYGIDEPTVKESLDKGVDLVLFSGDKLLGGPQAGIAVGSKQYIKLMRQHPLARAVRLDKMSIVALEAVFKDYWDHEYAKRNIPVISMITASADELLSKAERLEGLIMEQSDYYRISIEKTKEQIGGGSTPNQFLSGFVVTVESESITPDSLERALREYSMPVITRIVRDKIMIDMRTVKDVELEIIADALVQIARKRSNKNA